MGRNNGADGSRRDRDGFRPRVGVNPVGNIRIRHFPSLPLDELVRIEQTPRGAFVSWKNAVVIYGTKNLKPTFNPVKITLKSTYFRALCVHAVAEKSARRRRRNRKKNYGCSRLVAPVCSSATPFFRRLKANAVGV